jgi:hypothetical protein
MYLFDVIYYHFFLFYSKVLKDPEPHFATILAFSFCQSLFVNGLIDLITLKWFCYQIPVWPQFMIVLAMIYFNYLGFIRNGNAKKITVTQPTLMKNRGISIIVSLLFFFISISYLFWGPIYGRHLLSQCK